MNFFIIILISALMGIALLEINMFNMGGGYSFRNMPKSNRKRVFTLYGGACILILGIVFFQFATGQSIGSGVGMVIEFIILILLVATYWIILKNWLRIRKVLRERDTQHATRAYWQTMETQDTKGSLWQDIKTHPIISILFVIPILFALVIIILATMHVIS